MSSASERLRFQPARYERELSAILAACCAVDPLDDASLQRILRRQVGFGLRRTGESEGENACES
jgi:hypothetical protein